MIFRETPLAGVLVVEPEPRRDERGFFARTWCREEFAARGLNPHVEQCNTSFNRDRGTLRGLHFQADPYGEAKLVRCVRGGAWDVVVDLRPRSATRHRWTAVEITAENRTAVYVPEGCAHGFQTLTDETEILYQMSAAYRPEAARGIRWDDPALAIAWPVAEAIVSPRDAALPRLEPVPC